MGMSVRFRAYNCVLDFGALPDDARESMMVCLAKGSSH